MNDPAVNLFLAGMVTSGFLAGGLFFARFWVRSRDSLFLAFSAACKRGGEPWSAVTTPGSARRAQHLPLRESPGGGSGVAPGPAEYPKRVPGVVTRAGSIPEAS